MDPSATLGVGVIATIIALIQNIMFKNTKNSGTDRKTNRQSAIQFLTKFSNIIATNIFASSLSA